MPYMRCAFCENEFQPANCNQKYCRPRCCWLAWKARNPDPPLVPLACLGCGEMFTPGRRDHRVCSNRCWRLANPERAQEYHRRYQAKNPPPERSLVDCENCGVGTLRRRFCSDQCQYEHRRPSRVCAECGAEFRKRGRASGSGSLCLDCVPKRPEPKVQYRRVTKTPYSMRLHLRPKVRSFVAGECPSCGELFVAFAWTGTRFCSPVCQRREERHRRRAVKREAEKTEPIFRRRVFERDNWICRLCKKPVQQGALVPHPKAPTVDHILPLALGGSHTYSNVQCAHFICNSKKSANVIQLSFAA